MPRLWPSSTSFQNTPPTHNCAMQHMSFHAAWLGGKVALWKKRGSTSPPQLCLDLAPLLAGGIRLEACRKRRGREIARQL